MQTTNKLKAARTPSGSLIGRNEPRIFLELLQYFFKLSRDASLLQSSDPPPSSLKSWSMASQLPFQSRLSVK
ncbi:hypothetical protein V6N13_091551 [Hibiscus sabdariffa]